MQLSISREGVKVVFCKVSPFLYVPESWSNLSIPSANDTTRRLPVLVSKTGSNILIISPASHHLLGRVPSGLFLQYPHFIEESSKSSVRVPAVA